MAIDDFRIVPHMAEAIREFCPDGTVQDASVFGSGHIHDTFLIKISMGDSSEKSLILQKINTKVFIQPELLMDNIIGVTSFLRKKIAENGGDPDRETLTYLPARDGKAYYQDPSGEYWRCCLFIENSTSYDEVADPEIFFQSALAFGRFQRLLADYPADSLHEPIRGFHDTAARLAAFREAISEDAFNRASSVQDEIGFFLSRSHLSTVFTDPSHSDRIRLRVTHNDTKLNNVLFDRNSRKAICVIDLDTVMPGLAMNDFGDAVRHGANTAAEDETDLYKVALDLNLFRVFANGFIQGCGDSLTDEEIGLLPIGAMVMSYELGLRFLTDYLSGDIYFKTYRPNHNLDRARVQMTLLRDMERKQSETVRIVESLWREYRR